MDILIALQALSHLLAQASELNKLIVQARNENRDITEAELDGLALKDDEASQTLQAAIDKAKAAGG